MNPKTMIKGKIHYVGVNDRNKHLFEGMWPLPYGVSYNSYLIDDETVALVDTVDACYFEVYLRKIKSIIGERPIQYLIINHMEPDHSGSIRLIKQHYPDIVIVGNKQTFGMIEGFYGVTGEQYMVKDEDFLALGHHKLRFYMTPMVHWPETMMTFDETEGVLFAGDGFGCFGTVDGGFLDTRINLDRYWEEWYVIIPTSWVNMVLRCRKRWPSWAVCPSPPFALRTGRYGQKIYPRLSASTTS